MSKNALEIKRLTLENVLLEKQIENTQSEIDFRAKRSGLLENMTAEILPLVKKMLDRSAPQEFAEEQRAVCT